MLALAMLYPILNFFLPLMPSFPAWNLLARDKHKQPRVIIGEPARLRAFDWRKRRQVNRGQIDLLLSKLQLEYSFVGLHFLDFAQGQVERVEALLARSGRVHHHIPKLSSPAGLLGGAGFPFLS